LTRLRRLLVPLCIVVVSSGCVGKSAPQADRQSGRQSAPFRTGAEVLAADGFAPLLGLRVGAVVNQTSQVEGVHLVDAMLQGGVEVAALFGPEHGVRGEAGAGVAVESGRDPETGLPVYSLYGETRKPDAAVLADLDALVFDIQDVGARFYTYISTLGLTMQAAAEAGRPFYVLDRPNPLGGELVAGYVLEEGFESFVGAYPIPVAYGLTVGELAKMIKGEGWLPELDSLDLVVIELEGWNRTMRWPDLARTWVPTSPNIPDYETAAVYPGMCFLESLSVSEGRGTDRPFLQFGAPWITADSLAATLNARRVSGVRFTPTRYTPVSMPNAAPNPRYRDQELPGVAIDVTSDDDLEPLRLGVEVLVALRDHAAAADETGLIREASLRRLAGTNRLYEALQRGDTADEIVAQWQDEVKAFDEARAPYLLY
jgi:uncharacterized protein YbbC (DUF1343 family)